MVSVLLHFDGSRENSTTNNSTETSDDASDELVTQGPPKRRRLTDQHETLGCQRASSKLNPDVSVPPPFPILSPQFLEERLARNGDLSAESNGADPDAASTISSLAGTVEDTIDVWNSPETTLKAPKRRARGRPPKTSRSISAIDSLRDRGDRETPSIPPVKRPPGRPRGRGGKAVVPSKAMLGKMGLRLPGRRRANLDAQLEADLLRQAALKRSYRTLVRALKPALYELGERTQRDLEDDEQAHQQYAQFQAVQKALDERLKARLECVEAEYQLQKEQRAIMHRAERATTQRKLEVILQILGDHEPAY